MTYDFIFCGLGLSTMLLLDELERQGLLDDSSILILEHTSDFPEQTWCFWEQGRGRWDSLLSGSWSSGYFSDDKGRVEILRGLRYKSISAESMREHILDKLNHYECTFRAEKVVNWTEEQNGVSVYTSDHSYSATYFFNSAYIDKKETLKSSLLLQHFEGWYIRCEKAVFQADEAAIMDFTVPQKGNTRFMYVLPFSPNNALIEYTLFSPMTIPQQEYGQAIVEYLKRAGIVEFVIEKKEQGIVPMTAHPFWEKNTRRVLHIGTAGGWTKASTGYTFANAMKMAHRVAEFLKSDSVDFRKFHHTTRFNWYDRLFIDVLYNENAIGHTLFRALFTKTDPRQVMRFLNEETNLRQELRVIAACPTRPFLSALIRVILKK